MEARLKNYTKRVDIQVKITTRKSVDSFQVVMQPVQTEAAGTGVNGKCSYDNSCQGQLANLVQTE